MDKATETRIQNWQGPDTIHVGILATDHPEQPAFEGFAEQWGKLSPVPRWAKNDTESGLPGFALKENIIYSALPLERELDPFLKGLETLASPDLPPETIERLDRLQLPCELTLYIALQCPHCPAMVETLIPLAAHSDKIRLHIIDGTLFPDRAAADNVMAAPCLILDGEFRWTGAVEAGEIITMALNRDPAQLSTATLKNILEDGEADWIADRMIEAGQIFDGFIGLLLHDTWSVRLGAMVVVESLAERSPDLGADLAPALMDRFADQEIPVQGDILYALGEIGNLETTAWIREVSERVTHADLKDAAADALDAIESRLGSA